MYEYHQGPCLVPDAFEYSYSLVVSSLNHVVVSFLPTSSHLTRRLVASWVTSCDCTAIWRRVSCLSGIITSRCLLERGRGSWESGAVVERQEKKVSFTRLPRRESYSPASAYEISAVGLVTLLSSSSSR